jgi:hypothetical protein
MKKAARSQNAVTISSISRPVTIKMPDETRRKVESVARARKQATTLQSLLGKQVCGSGSDEEFDENGSTWLGTALHGLMESPRTSTTSLSKVAKTLMPTRAAVGFSKARSQRSHHSFRSPLESSDMEISPIEKPESPTARTGESSDDDDLDAPIRARETRMVNRPLSHCAESRSLFIRQESKDNQSDSVDVPGGACPSETKCTNVKQIPLDASKAARERIAKRLEQAKLRETKQEGAKLDVIPTFLS